MRCSEIMKTHWQCSIYLYIGICLETLSTVQRHLQKPALAPLQWLQFSCDMRAFESSVCGLKGLWHYGSPKGRIMVGKSVERILFLIPSCLIFISQMEHQKSRIHTQPKEFSARSGNNPRYAKLKPPCLLLSLLTTRWWSDIAYV